MSLSSSSQKKPCTNWEQFGACRFGAGCHFTHTMPTFAPATAAPIACKNMLATGTCKFGSHCRFEHAAPIPRPLDSLMDRLSIEGQVQPLASAAEHPLHEASDATAPAPPAPSTAPEPPTVNLASEWLCEQGVARPRLVNYATQCPKGHCLLRKPAGSARLCRMCVQHVAHDDSVMTCDECRHIVCMTCRGALQDSQQPRPSRVAAATDDSDAFPLVGVTLPFLLQFKAEWEHIYHNLTTGQMCQVLVRPRTFLSKLSVCDALLKSGDPRASTRPTWFLSHTWSNRFADTIDSALLFFQSLPHDDVVIWMDVFSVSQHETPQLSQWWMRTFRDAISSIGNLLMVMQPWNDPVSMKRAWCVIFLL
jgi:hypothetical protein